MLKQWKNYDYTFIIEDSDGDYMLLYIDWGFLGYQSIIDNLNYGKIYTKSHSWPSGNYTIGAYVEDKPDAEISEFSTLEITMPTTRSTNYLIFDRLQNIFINIQIIKYQILCSSYL
jgi:hypothetical protein